MQFYPKTAAVHWCWVTAHLYEEQISISVTAVTHCCEPVLQDSTEQSGMQFYCGSSLSDMPGVIGRRWTACSLQLTDCSSTLMVLHVDPASELCVSLPDAAAI